MQARGIFLTVLSAVLYGLNPLFSKTINVGGCNSLTQTFARLAAGIVIFFILLVCSGSGSVREKLRLSRQELKDILICCIGYGLIGPLLFASYNYLASGLATTLHFVYPVLVVVACIAFRYERANRRKLVCCALCFAGILCFYTPGGDVSAYGVFLALASGVAWAYYIVHLNSSGLVTMAPFKLAFWLCVFSAVLVGGITLAMGEFVWPSTAFTRGALAWGVLGALAVRLVQPALAALAAGIPSAVTNTVLLCLGIDALWSTGVLLRWGDIDLLAPSRLRRKYRTA